ncbi:MAG TPA: copper chaperone PCu(A)C [Dehalococcoidia bacterium]|nr:copper chaperone PCu(A)C [Dehalococcoidia bacterium]
MRYLKLTRLLASIAVLALLMFAAAACGDDDEDTGDDGTEEIAIMEPFGRATLDTASAYFTIKNNGDTDDALVAASAPVADMVSLHEVVTQGAESKMQPVDKIDVPAGGETQLKPGGLHVMLEELTQDLKEGDSYTLTLEFESGLTMDVEITVESYTSDSGMEGGM